MAALRRHPGVVRHALGYAGTPAWCVIRWAAPAPQPGPLPRPGQGAPPAARPAGPAGGPARGPRRRRLAGFTLLEILITLVILGIALGAVIPKLQEMSGVQLRSAARRLAGAARYAGDQAATRKATVRIRFDFDARAYRVEVLDGEVWQADRANLGAPVQLPGQVRVAAVETRGRGRRTEGEAWIEFYPKGYAEPAVVQLAVGDERVYTVEVRPFDMRPVVHAGALRLRDAEALATVPAVR